MQPINNSNQNNFCKDACSFTIVTIGGPIILFITAIIIKYQVFGITSFSERSINILMISSVFLFAISSVLLTCCLCKLKKAYNSPDVPNISFKLPIHESQQVTREPPRTIVPRLPIPPAPILTADNTHPTPFDKIGHDATINIFCCLGAKDLLKVRCISKGAYKATQSEELISLDLSENVPLPSMAPGFISLFAKHRYYPMVTEEIPVGTDPIQLLKKGPGKADL